MTFEEFINNPQIKKAINSNDPYTELEKLFGNNPLARNAINLARRMPNNKQLENMANNVCNEANVDINNINNQRNKFGR